MKASKASLQNSAQEECGVWLDTVQLKEKAKKKRLVQPISKLLNPLAEGEGYSLAVALHFTQTKTEMPKTKQSSISTFFTPHRRVLHKMSSSESVNVDAAQPFSSTSAAHTDVASVKKRGQDVGCKTSDVTDLDVGVDCEQESENMSEIKAAQWQNQDEHHLPSLNCESEACKPPQGKRRHTETSLLLDVSQPPQAWSQDPLFTFSQFSERDFYPTEKNYTKNFKHSQSRLLNEDVFGNQIHVEGTTSTQKHDQKPSQIEDDKENRSVFFSFSDKHLTSLSSQKRAEPEPSPRKLSDHRWNKAGKEERFDSTKPSSSDLKPPEANEVDEDSLASLFTQDSEGFRVIAHRGQQTRSPLKDQSNLSTEWSWDYKPVEDDEMLFTQDSQGNTVIKH